MTCIQNQRRKTMKKQFKSSGSYKISIPQGGYTHRDNLVRRETIEKIEKIIDNLFENNRWIIETCDDQTYLKNVIKNQLKIMKEKSK